MMKISACSLETGMYGDMQKGKPSNEEWVCLFFSSIKLHVDKVNAAM